MLEQELAERAVGALERRAGDPGELGDGGHVTAAAGRDVAGEQLLRGGQGCVLRSRRVGCWSTASASPDLVAVVDPVQYGSRAFRLGGQALFLVAVFGVQLVDEGDELGEGGKPDGPVHGVVGRLWTARAVTYWTIG